MNIPVVIFPLEKKQKGFVKPSVLPPENRDVAKPKDAEVIHGVAHGDVSVHSWDHRGGFLENAPVAREVSCKIHPAPVCRALSLSEEQMLALA